VQVTLTQNLPPSSGALHVFPARGTVLDTIYELSAEEWVDPKVPVEDYPLRFSFGYIDRDGNSKPLESGSLLTSISARFPPGSDTVGCLPAESLCRRLQVTLKVSDALLSEGGPSEPKFIWIDNMDPSKIRETVERELASAQKLRDIATDMRSGSELLAKTSTIADTLNDHTVNFDFHGMSAADKTKWRDSLISHVDFAMKEVITTLTVHAIIQALGSISGVLGANLELSKYCVDTALSLLQDINDTLLRLARRGSIVPGFQDVLRVVRISLGQTATAASRLTSQRRSGQFSRSLVLTEEEGIHTSLQTPGMKRQLLPGQTGMHVTNTINGLSKLSVAFHTAGQFTALQETKNFNMRTDRIEKEQMQGFKDTIIGSEVSRCLGCVRVVPRLEYQFPSGLSQRRASMLTTDSYEVQSTLIYDMILPEDRTPFMCISKANHVYWSSDPVLVPTDVSGNTAFQRFRTNVGRMEFVSCRLLSVVALIQVRELHSDKELSQLDESEPVTIRLTFDPTVREEITDGSVDPFTGLSSSASCVRWDESLRMWTSAGIQHVTVFLGNSSGTGAYVECKTKFLGTFAVSEVPVLTVTFHFFPLCTQHQQLLPLLS
jgi:hypothetical protein